MPPLPGTHERVVRPLTTNTDPSPWYGLETVNRF